MPTQANEVQLTCGCRRDYKPQPAVGDLVYCARHPNSRSYVDVVVGAVWAARCQTRCRYSRTFGMDETSADRAATNHVNKNPGHEVEVSKGAELVRIIKTDGQGVLNILMDADQEGPLRGPDATLRQDPNWVSGSYRET